MMNVSLDDARQLLESQLPPLDEHAAKLELELATVNDSRTRVRAALTALSGSPEKADRSNIDANVLVQLFEQFLSDKGPLPIAELDSLVRAKAKELGYTLAGYGPCKKSALKHRQFETDSKDRVTLRQPSRDLNIA